MMPPGRGSLVRLVILNPFGPHHSVRCLGSVQTFHIRSRGASNTRDMTKSSVVPSWGLFPAATFPLLGLHIAKVFIEPIEAFGPKLAIALEPVVDVLERARRQRQGRRWASRPRVISSARSSTFRC